MRNNNSKKTIKLVTIALFSALAFVTTMLCKFIPNVAGFLSLEVKDAIIVICALIFGPISGLTIAIFVPIIELFTISTTGWYGLVMNILSSATFVLVTGTVYKYKRSFGGAILGLVTGVFSVTAVMLVANLLVTPLYLKYIGVNMPREAFLKMIPTVLLPFNFVKTTLNASLVLLLYKPISRVVKRCGFGDKAMSDGQKMPMFTKKTVIAYAISIVLIVASLFVALVVLK